MGKEATLPFLALAQKVADAVDAHVFIHNGPIQEPQDRELINQCRVATPKAKNVVLIVTTNGGSAHCAYRMARCLLRNYERVTVIVSGPCFSAGTLLAVGAKELVISDHGMLGPLDVQISKPDELWEMSSGLTVPQAISTLQGEAFQLFENCMLQLKGRSGGQITLKTAMEIAAKLTTGLFEPIYAQIDPMRLGEHGRFMRVAEEYGHRLKRTAQNLKHDESLEKLLVSYPSHSFVIDREEAASLFKSVRAPNSEEESLLESLGEFAVKPNTQKASLYLLAPAPVTEAPSEPQRAAGTQAGGKPEGHTPDPAPTEEPLRDKELRERTRPQLV